MADQFRSTFPGLYVDLVQAVDPNRAIVLVNRDPEPNECFVRVGQDLTFDILSLDGNAIEFDSITVYINGLNVALISETVEADVITNVGSFVKTLVDEQVIVSFSLIDQECTAISGGYRCFYTPYGGWQPNTAVTVRVIATNGVETIDETYIFKIEDKLSPQIKEIIPWAKKKIRVVFNEPVTSESSTGAFDALNLANWSIANANDGKTAVAGLNIVAIDKVNEFTVDITTDIEQSIGGPYRIVPINIIDLNNNLVDSETNSLFNGFTPDMPASRRWDLFKMLPQQAVSDDEGIYDLRRVVSAWQDVVNIVLCSVDSWRFIIDPDLVPEEKYLFLDAMLQDLGNPFKFDLSVDQKRSLVRNLVNLYKLKGTKSGIIFAAKFFLNINVVDIIDYNNSGMELGFSELGVDWELNASSSFAIYAFVVQVDEILSESTERTLKELINYLKPAHTHLVDVIGPLTAGIIDHWELGDSNLGVNTFLHEG